MYTNKYDTSEAGSDITTEARPTFNFVNNLQIVVYSVIMLLAHPVVTR